jgi:NAD(P)-dependent dehydrogenase (short-subunit alcohol dehydrogenase family)
MRGTSKYSVSSTARDLQRIARGSAIANVIGAGRRTPPPDYIAGTSGNAALMASYARVVESVDHGIRVVGVNPTYRNRAPDRPHEGARGKDAWRCRAEGNSGEGRGERRFRRWPVVSVADLGSISASARASHISGTIDHRLWPVNAGAGVIIQVFA